ncbi:MAG: hypothetical protein RL069_631, partial [Planctomycetota bacterium]
MSDLFVAIEFEGRKLPEVYAEGADSASCPYVDRSLSQGSDLAVSFDDRRRHRRVDSP